MDIQPDLNRMCTIDFFFLKLIRKVHIWLWFEVCSDQCFLTDTKITRQRPCSLTWIYKRSCSGLQSFKNQWDYLGWYHFKTLKMASDWNWFEQFCDSDLGLQLLHNSFRISIATKLFCSQASISEQLLTSQNRLHVKTVMNFLVTQMHFLTV